MFFVHFCVRMISTKIALESVETFHSMVLKRLLGVAVFSFNGSFELSSDYEYLI